MEDLLKNGVDTEREQVEKMVEQYLEMAYARVSTPKQKLDRQLNSIIEAIPNLKARYIYSDKWTGKEFNREHYVEMKEKMVELLEANPTTKIRLTVHELDRIGRNFMEIQNEIQWFESRGIVLNFLDIPQELIRDSTGVTGKLILQIVILLKAYWAEQELNIKQKRAEEGIARAHAAGKVLGRKEVVIDDKKFRQQADRAISKSISHAEAMRNLGLTSYMYWKHISRLYPEYSGTHSK